MPDKIRSRLWCVLLYPDDPTHVQALESIREQFNYVGILHDKDTWTEDEVKDKPDHKPGDLKKAHYHLILKFTQARWNTALATELGIGINYFEQCRNWEYAAPYLVHDGLNDKFQYDTSELEGPLVPAVMKLLADKDENSRVIELMKLIQSMGYIEYETLVIKACENGMYSDLRRMGYILSRIVDAHNETYAREFEKRKKYKSDRDKFAGFCDFVSDKDIQPWPYD